MYCWCYASDVVSLPRVALGGQASHLDLVRPRPSGSKLALHHVTMHACMHVYADALTHFSSVDAEGW